MTRKEALKALNQALELVKSVQVETKSKEDSFQLGWMCATISVGQMEAVLAVQALRDYISDNDERLK